MKKISIIAYIFLALGVILTTLLEMLPGRGMENDGRIYMFLVETLPAIGLLLFSFALIKKPKIFDKFKKTISLSAIGILITLVTSTTMVIMVFTADKGLGFSILFIFGMLFSFILACIGFIFDLIKLKSK